MASKKQFYTLDEANKVIIIDKSVSPTEQDVMMLQIYGGMGFTVHEKIQRTASKKNKQLLDSEIKKALENNKEALAEYERIKKSKKEGGFFKARKYANGVIEAEKEKKAKKG